ncbi:MAG: chemotaxis protein CheX [Lachnospiraceae bacterium]|nr:chemotaxis protein CheX [Lachnospiraceae bacterium]
MVTSIVGNYLIQRGMITPEQYKDILKEQRKVRVKLGLIAVAEGLMTQEEANRVNQLQAVMDMRFGDIAVSKGYLTEGQVESLLKKQGNAYLTFAQALENQQLMTVEQLDQCLVDFQYANNLTASDMEALKSDDIEKILRLYLPMEAEKYVDIAGIAVRTIARLIDTELYPEKAFMASEVEVNRGALQYVEGDNAIHCGMAGNDNELLFVASTFGQEEFDKVDEDALDAVGELLNCINGLYASARSKEGVSLELLPPEFSVELSKMTCKEMLVLPLNVGGSRICFLIAMDNKIEMN